MRSKLCVPAPLPERFDTAVGGTADAVSFDLEDAVQPAHEAAARQALADGLKARAAAASGPRLRARHKPPGSADFDADLANLQEDPG